MIGRADRFTVLLDANVLVGALKRNMLLSLAEVGLFRPRWSASILEEVERALIKLYFDEEMAKRQCVRMEEAYPGARVDFDEALLAAIHLADPDDRHVVAAAIATKATLIVTENLKDFPLDSLAHHELEAVSIDDFLADLLDLAGPEAVTALRTMRQRLKKPKLDGEVLIRRIEEQGLVQTADLLSEYRELL